MRTQLSDVLRLRSDGASEAIMPGPSLPLPPIAASESCDGTLNLATEQPRSLKFHCPFDASCAVEFDAQTPDKAQLKDHCRTSHGKSISTCHWRHTNDSRVCGERLKNRNGLLRHVAQVHLRSNTVVCPRCSQTLSRSDAYNLHSQKCR
ncbi:hypothetical protein C8Q72DRAFT_278604 [Fomitopsis betulina]|nr:hypothetical protein C8Q72DRAFT_278604 [Fomitopsis betulina]